VSPCGVHATAGNVRRAAQGVSTNARTSRCSASSFGAPTPNLSVLLPTTSIRCPTKSTWRKLRHSRPPVRWPLAQLYAAVVDQDSTVLITGITGALATTVAALASTFDARVIGLTRRPQAVHAGLNVTALDTARDDLAQALIETTNGKGVTIVIDNVADPATFDRYFPALARGARVVISGAIGSPQPPRPAGAG